MVTPWPGKLEGKENGHISLLVYNIHTVDGSGSEIRLYNQLRER